MHKISAIVPVYNSQGTIVDCLDSIINQTVKIQEIIIVDDGSTDSSAAIIEEYIKNYDQFNIILIRTKNSGPSSARNIGIERANNELVAFLDSDDRWIPEKTAIQLDYLTTSSEEVVLIGSMHPLVKKVSFKDGYISVSQRQLLWGNCFPTSSVIALRKKLLIYKFREGQKYSEDYGLWLKLSSLGKCLLIDQPLILPGKPIYGATGLSSKLWEMEKGEFINYKSLLKKGDIKLLEYYFFCSFSFIKFLRRKAKSLSKKAAIL